MSACEKCWAEATFRARLRGTMTAEEYPRVLAEHDHDPDHQQELSTGRE